MSANFEKHCVNCLFVDKSIREEPCVKCSHAYEDHWVTIAAKITEDAKRIKSYCLETDCVNCPFYKANYEPVCLLAPKDDNNTPATWEV